MLRNLLLASTALLFAAPASLAAEVAVTSAITTTKTGNPCDGMLILVNNVQLGTVLTADAGGAAFFAIPVLPGACGRNVVAVDVSTCVSSTPIVI